MERAYVVKDLWRYVGVDLLKRKKRLDARESTQSFLLTYLFLEDLGGGLVGDEGQGRVGLLQDLGQLYPRLDVVRGLVSNLVF